PARIEEDGKAAHAAVLRDYDWERKGEQMNTIYHQTLAQAVPKPAQPEEEKRYTGIGSTAAILHRMVSFKGMAACLLILLFIGAAGFVSLSQLKRRASEIVYDTLPGLSYAGQANAYLADAYRT